MNADGRSGHLELSRLKLSSMSRPSAMLKCGLASVLVFAGSVSKSLSQSSVISDSPQGEVFLTKLSPLSYPPLARQTRIAGDVALMLGVRQDGSVESAVVVSGHPLLQQVALDSARQSQYECRKCSQGITSYRLVYTFQLVSPTDCCKADDASSSKDQQDQAIPRVTQSQNHVTVVDQPLCICDPAIDVRKVRSVKCLYLWRCGKVFGIE